MVRTGILRQRRIALISYARQHLLFGDCDFHEVRLVVAAVPPERLLLHEADRDDATLHVLDLIVSRVLQVG